MWTDLGLVGLAFGLTLGVAWAQAPAPAASSEGMLGRLEREAEAYSQEVTAYRRDVADLVEYQYQTKRAEIQQRYSAVVDRLSLEERLRRDEAVRRFEEFLAKYPNNTQYTPDALFRLAELQFEKSNDQYVTALEQYDMALKDYDRGRLAVEPAEPKQDYRETIRLFDRLIARWPRYRNLDGAYYLKGYCLLEMGEDREALDQFKALVQNYPDSRFVPETWTRIGEYHFDYNQLPEAIAAYKSVLEHEKSPYYDKALYKLAWTYYRNDQYDDAISRFKQLIEFSDAQAAKTGEAGSDLRSEAVQYLAISVQEEDWNGDGLPDEDSGFGRALRYLSGEKAYEREILDALSGIYFDNAKYAESVEATRFMLEKFPSNGDNPALHAKMIQALERQRLFDQAFAERAALAKAYGPGTSWHESNKENPEALEKADELAERALIQAATYHHTRAQDLREKARTGEPGAEQQAIQEYGLAAAAYENYLAKYEKSENAYELSYLYADCLFYSFRFPEAAVAYVKVRDSKLGTKYQEPAAFSAVISQEETIKRAIQSGQLEPRPSLLNKKLDNTSTKRAGPKGAETEGVRTFTPEPIPKMVQTLLASRQAYVEGKYTNEEDPSRLPRIAYKLGETYFDYKDHDEARKWFSWLIEHYPKEQVTVFAAGNIIDSYRLANDWEKMAEWSGIIEKANLGTAEEQRALAAEVRVLKVGALFKAAEKLFKDQQYEKAAAEYVRLVEENPGNRFADRALNNAAVAYEKTRRFESATSLYQRIYKNYPQSEFAENALYRVAVNSERFFDFDRAIQTALQLVEKYPSSEHRADALFQAATLQEQTQRYRAAAKNIERYTRMFPNRDDTAATYYRAADNYRKLGDTRNEIRIYTSFVQTYGSNPKNNGKVIEALATIAERLADQGKRRKASKAWGRVINEFNSRGMQPGTVEAKYPAKARFLLISNDFEKYRTKKLAGSLPNQGRIIKDLQRRLKDLERQYAEVLEYKSIEWTLAAFYRLGHIYQLFAEKLYEAPIPGGFNPDEEDMYRTQLEDLALPIEDKAVQRFELAQQKAREFKVVNEWTKRIVAALHKFKPSDYPLFKEERRLESDLILTRSRFLVPRAKAPEPVRATPPPAPQGATPVADPKR